LGSLLRLPRAGGQVTGWLAGWSCENTALMAANQLPLRRSPAPARLAPLLLLNIPAKTNLGLDLGPTTGECFKGFCGFANVPHGLHLLGVNDHEALFVHIQGLTVLNYDVGTETFALETERADAFAAGLARGDFNNGLVPYEDETWQRVSDAIPACLARLSIAMWQKIDAAKISFVAARRKPMLASWSPARRTRAMETFSGMLSEFFADDVRALLGELQLAFVLFLGVSSIESLQAWLGMVRLLATCWPPPASRGEVAAQILQVLTAQLGLFPGNLLEESETDDLLACLQTLAHGLGGEAEARFRHAAVKLFGAQFERQGLFKHEADDELPQVVLGPTGLFEPPMHARAEALSLDLPMDVVDAAEASSGPPPPGDDLATGHAAASPSNSRMEWML
jgi:hypothetical protein